MNEKADRLGKALMFTIEHFNSAEISPLDFAEVLSKFTSACLGSISQHVRMKAKSTYKKEDRIQFVKVVLDGILERTTEVIRDTDDSCCGCDRVEYVGKHSVH